MFRNWISLVPTGLTHQKPQHYREMLRAAWENRDELPFTYRILRDGVCDGCALGTSGLSDWTIPGIHLAPLGVAQEPGTFFVSTRRGKHFNSMVQKDIDPLTGASREAVLMSREDARALDLSEGSRVRLVSSYGHFVGRVFPAAVRPGNLEVHWPEGAALLGPEVDPESMEPDFNAVVTVQKF